MSLGMCKPSFWTSFTCGRVFKLQSLICHDDDDLDGGDEDEDSLNGDDDDDVNYDDDDEEDENDEHGENADAVE